ncbi:DNA repair exonuclease [Candidatus Pacearchaeota archaeon]|nr:DNA repair exonuclease [Candidatus Pacearchaeota archaeon]
MKFAHLGDCHLGGWRQPELKELNFRSFQLAITKCINENVDFILVSGDLFDSAYPPIETLKETFEEFRKLKDKKIPVFIIAGSHDYSVTGKTFLDVLEKAGFCTNVALFEERNGKIMLQPTIFRNIALYGYPGKKSGLEVDDIERISLQDAPGLFKILMLHTAIRDAVGTLPIPAVNEKNLPPVDYLALGHLHVKYSKNGRVYSGPTFPNNLSELEELQGGSFYIFDKGNLRREYIKIKDVLTIDIEIKDALQATENILGILEKKDLADKIVILKLHGILEQGKTGDIDFTAIEMYVRKRKAFVFLKSTTKLLMPEPELRIDITENSNLEETIVKKFEESHPSKFNPLIDSLLRSLQLEKMEDEKSSVFEERLLAESKKVLNL